MILKRVSKPAVCLAAGACACAGAYIWNISERAPVLELHIFDTSGAPSIFIRTPNDARILFGGGANTGIVRRITSILPFYSRRIDAVIVPRADAKSATGLIDVLGRYSVGELIVPKYAPDALGLSSSTDPAYALLMKAANDNRIPVRMAEQGDSFDFDSRQGMTVRAKTLFPARPDSFAYSVASGPEILMRISYGNTAIGIIGAASPKIQRYVATTSGELLRSDALASFQNPNSNLAPAFMRAVSPDYFIYTQKPGTKKAGVLAGFVGDHGMNLKERGEVTVTSDGRTVTVR